MSDLGTSVNDSHQQSKASRSTCNSRVSGDACQVSCVICHTMSRKQARRRRFPVRKPIRSNFEAPSCNLSGQSCQSDWKCTCSKDIARKLKGSNASQVSSPSHFGLKVFAWPTERSNRVWQPTTPSEVSEGYERRKRFVSCWKGFGTPISRFLWRSNAESKA